VVDEGTLTAILGASGSGKTTLLRLLMGFIRPDRGTISVGGTLVEEAGGVHVLPDKRHIGYVAQEGALFPHLTVAENIGFGLPRGERRQGSRVGEALDLVDLPRSYAARQPQQLSGGEQRRVALARALVPGPAVVLLDEPFSGLDAALRAETRTAVLQAMTAAGATGILVTHDQAEALSMGDEVAVLREGRLVAAAPPAELYRSPADLDVARFVGDAVVVPGEAGDGTVRCELGTLPIRNHGPQGKVQVMVRPEQIRVSRDANGAAGVAATVVGRSFFGPETMLRLELRDAAATPVLARVLGEDAPGDGEQVALTVDGPVAVYPAQQA
jgi:iron(III) transport system ATP-binding protein